MVLTAALNLRWHKACKKELSVSFIISKKVPLEAEEWPCSAGLTYATGLMVELCWREAHRNITTPEAGLAVTINQGTKIMHQTHSFKSSKNDLKKKNFSRISLLFVITCVQGDPCMTKISPGENFRKVIMYPEAKWMWWKLKTNGGKGEFLFQRIWWESLLNGFYFPSLIFTHLFNCDFKAVVTMTVCLLMTLFYFTKWSNWI